MSKLLYITANSKPESLSTSKQVGRYFINKYKELNPKDEIIELDLYNENIPEIDHLIFTSRATLTSGENYDNLSLKKQKDIDQVKALCEQFLSADKYVIAAPMWSVNFPSILKRYIDCILINKKTINIDEIQVYGLLDDKVRKMVYIQSSGGKYPPIISHKLNHGVSYLKDLFKFLGVYEFKKIAVEGTGDKSIGVEKAKYIAFKDIDKYIDEF